MTSATEATTGTNGFSSSSTVENNNNNHNTERLAPRYYARLGLDATTTSSLPPTIETLRILQEAHVAHIPFENLSQHGCTQPATLNLHQIATKVLDTNRGGFCFELNGLFAALLEQELGYIVCRVPAYVYINECEYRDVATHMALIVTCPSTTTTPSSTWFVDVAFGEPAIHPLLYLDQNNSLLYQQEQITPEGMQSKLVRDDNDDVHLMWYRPEHQKWVNRLRWKYQDSILGSNGPSLASFQPGLDAVLQESSIFGQKLICCLISRTMKRTMAGSRLKVTGPPRFNNDNNSIQSPNDADSPIVTNGDHSSDSDPTAGNNNDGCVSSTKAASPQQVVTQLESVEAVRQILANEFGISLEQSVGLTLTKSHAADPTVWTHM